ncbi:unnamed protein product [Prunus armeniaca]
MRSYGEELSQERVVQKLLISLPSAYDFICSVIEHSKDLDVIKVQEVVASLKSFELRLDRHSENKTKSAFASLSENPKPVKFTGNQNAKHQKNWKAKGKKWDSSSTDGARNPCKHYEKLHFGREDLHDDIDKNVTAKVEMGTGQLVEVTGKRNLVVETKIGKQYIKEVMLVLGLKENLFSVGQTMEHGYYLVFGDHKVEIYYDSSYSNMVARVQMRGNRSFPMKLQSGIHIAYKANVYHSTTMWHRRLGHLNMSSLKLMQEQEMVVELPEIKAVKGVCEGCVLGKQCREAFPREATTRASTPLELIHSDIYGPMQTTTKAGNRYFLTFIDDYTGMCWVYFLRHKSEVLSVFKRFKAIVGLQSGYKLKKLISERGGEYTSVKFDRFYEDVGMERQLTTPYTPQQNGVAERKNRTIVEMPKCLMLKKKFHLNFGLRQSIPLYACWDWNAQKERSVSIQITEVLEGEQGHEGSSCDSEAQCEVSEVPSSSTEICDQERMTGPQDIDHTPLKYKSIAEVYEKCNLCIIEPENFVEAAKDESWRSTIWFCDTSKEDKVYRLKKALYGLKQAPRAWYEEINSYFTKAGFHRSPSEATLYTKTSHNGILIVSLYVDDIVYIRSSKEMMTEFKNEMMRQYVMTNLGLLHHFLGLGVLQTYTCIFLHQKKYAKTLLEKFGLKDCKSIATPLAVNKKLSRIDGSDLADETLYRQMVGSLLYLTATRPYIMFAASLLARFMHNPTKKHMGTTKRVLRYIQGTVNYGIAYEEGKGAVLIGYCDSDWSGSEDDMRNTSEYISAAEATAQAIWLRFVLSDFGEEQAEPTQLLCDNTSAIPISKNPVHHHKTRHINRRFHFIRDALQDGEIDLLYCKSKEQIAGIFIKALARDQFEFLRKALGVISTQHLEGSPLDYSPGVQLRCNLRMNGWLDLNDVMREYAIPNGFICTECVFGAGNWYRCVEEVKDEENGTNFAAGDHRTWPESSSQATEVVSVF